MIKKTFERELESRTKMREGKGTVVIKHYFKRDELNTSCRLCAELIIPPGAEIGLHEHNNEDEIFIIQKGNGVVVDDGKEVEVEPGDSILTGRGASHSIKNIGDEDLVVTAVIIVC